MYSPKAISRDINSNLMYSSSSSSNHGFKHGFIDGGSFFKSKEILGSSSDLFQSQTQNQNQQQEQNSGLMRYRSAPSSYFASYLDGYNTTTTNNNNNNNHSSSSNNGDSSESESIFSALMNNCSEIESSNDLMSQRHHHNQVLHVSSCPMKLEMNEVQSNPPQQQLHHNNGNGNGFSCADNNNNDIVQIGGYQAAVSAGGGTVVGSYTVPVGMENQLQMRINNNSSTNNNNNSGTPSNLIRQSSSPAGFFSGFNVMRGEVGKFSNNGETSSSNSGLNFASGPPCSSSSRYMPSIAEHGNETVETAAPDNTVPLRNLNETTRTTAMDYTSGFSTESWNEPPPPAPPAAPPAFSILKRNRDGDFKMFSDFNRLENQDGETSKHSHTLTHHLSLPKTAGEMAIIEKYLQFQQDSVPCKIRAKRGCATHPRSIAERMRRTRISERMKKLQELFPNMDKQTNTADMLDLAVEHIKDLQNQVQTLNETRAKCKCTSKPTPSPNAKA